MGEVRCASCEAVLAPAGSKFCHQCGTEVAQAPSVAPPWASDTAETPAPPPPPWIDKREQTPAAVPPWIADAVDTPAPPWMTEATTPPPPVSDPPRPRQTPNLLIPVILGIAGIALLVAGVVSASDADNPGVSEALRSSGVFSRPVPTAPTDISVPQDTVADFTANHDATPQGSSVSTATDSAFESWPVALSTTFSDDVAWYYGVSGALTRTFTGETYTVSRTPEPESVLVPTWRGDPRPADDFYLAVDIVGGEGASRCGLLIGSEEFPMMFFLTDSIDGSYEVLGFPTGDKTQTLAEGEQRIAIRADEANRVALLKDGETITIFSNETPLASFDGSAYDVADVGLSMFAPPATETAVCEYDNFEIRSP